MAQFNSPNPQRKSGGSRLTTSIIKPKNQIPVNAQTRSSKPDVQTGKGGSAMTGYAVGKKSYTNTDNR